MRIIIFNNSETVHSSGTHYTTTKASTGSMIGRAVVGGALFGGVGAVIGGSTAKRISETDSSSSYSYTSNNYDIVITLNSLATPILKLEIGENQEAMQKISSLLSVIIERNKQSCI